MLLQAQLTVQILISMFILVVESFALVSAQLIIPVHVHCTKNTLLSLKQLKFFGTNYGHPIFLATDVAENYV